METVFAEIRGCPLFAFYLSALLRLNAFLRLTLSGVSGARRPPREEEDVDVDQRRHSCCSTRPRPLSRTSGDDVCSPVCWGGDTGAERVKLVRLVLPVVPTLCRGAVSVCSTVVALIHVAPSVLCANLRPGVSTAVTVCGCIRPVLFTVLTVTGYCTQLLDLPSL
ncbi:hypothetical protein Q5P01_014677 [Channa striata]|uniref:Uncharacterized protein n=1 Tax=Channa striata TaxID=64152 RepID=A0AA88MHN8_CHASR|nr:hypothetical protein Q5P01_014677 [Channa striata]